MDKTMSGPSSRTAGNECKLISCHIHSSQHPTRRRPRHRMGQVDCGNWSQLAPTASKHQVNHLNQLNEIMRPTKTATRRARRLNAALVASLALVMTSALCLLLAGDCLAQEAQLKQIDAHATQPSIERQLDTPAAGAPASSSTSSSSTSSSGAAGAGSSSSQAKLAGSAAAHKAHRPAASSVASQKKAAAVAAAASLASQTNYDKYQLKASPSSHTLAALSSSLSSTAPGASEPAALKSDKGEKVKAASDGNNGKADASAQNPQSASAQQPAHKKAGPTTQKTKSSSFALLKKFLPSFMTSAAAAAAAASAAVSSPANQHSRSSAPSTSSSALFAHLTGDGPLSYASGKLVNLLAGGVGVTKKKGPLGAESASAIPNHAPFFMRKSAVDRQAGGGAVALASSLLSSPLKLGLLFSAPLLPSLLLTPLAIAGLSPAMSAINNFFGDDDEPAQSSSAGPLAALASGPNSPLASILQATGVSPLPSQAGASPTGSESSASGSSSSSSAGGNFALQAFQSLLLGPTSTTERPLFNPGMFASSGIGNAMGSLASSMVQSSNSGSGSSSSSSASNSQSRPLFGGGLIQTAASMISPTYAAPPSSSGSASSSSPDDDGPGIMQMASDVFEKVANYMGSEGSGANKDIAQASGSGSGSSSGSSSAPFSTGGASSSPLSTLASLSSLSPFQLSSLFAPTAFGSAINSASTPAAHSSGSSGAGGHRAGFFSTLRNVYELFSSSFLRRQEVGDSNECQQRLVCELHQRAMGSKLFRRSLQSNLMELANLDRNLIEQLKYGPQTMQARVDPDTRAMLSDFLKAANNFKSGRELVNCGQMFPKCSRAQLLSAANAHLNDPVNGRTIGKFSQLMKKMKFKANQQHQSQWKLRKPSAKATPPVALGGGQQQQQQQQSQPAADYMQVAPLSTGQNGAKAALAPVDSLKLAQQILMLSQMSQPQAQLQQINTMASQFSPSSVAPPSPSPLPSQTQIQIQPQIQSQPQPQQQPQQYRAATSSQYSQQPSYLANTYLAQYSPAPAAMQTKQTAYTDAIMPGQTYPSATESPYFGSAISSQQQQFLAPQQMDSLSQFSPQQQQPQQQQQQQQQTNQYQSSYQNYAPSVPMSVEPIQQQQQQTQQLQSQPQQPIGSQQATSLSGQDVSKQQNNWTDNEPEEHNGRLRRLVKVA